MSSRPIIPALWRLEMKGAHLRINGVLDAPDRRSRHAARRVLARKSKSFSWAARLFDRDTADDVAALYHFCRLVDDIADQHEVSVARHRLTRIREDLGRGESPQPEVSALIDLARRRHIDLRLPDMLIDAVRTDTGEVRLASEDELLRYAYGVASTVGLMMCAVMGVRERSAHPFAIDLGIAMQLTNIARDVVEDAWRERRYLPADWLGGDLSPARIRTGAPIIRRLVRDARERLLGTAEAYYRSADRGMRFIPWRARLAVMTAARLYEAIGDRLRSGEVAWGQRAVVDRNAKLRLTLQAWRGLLINPKFWNVGRRPLHAARLHRALAGRPGVNAEPS